MSTNKITENLSWNAIKNNYHIGAVRINGATVQVNELQTAIDNGTIKQLIDECAEQLYAGDVASVCRVLKHNLASARTNTSKRPDTPTKAKDLTRIELMWSYVDSLMGAATVSSRQNKSGKSYWTWSMDEIMAVPLSDVRTLQSIRDNMASAKAKYPERIENMDEFMIRYKAASKRLSEAKAAQKQGCDSDELDKLIKQLEAGRLTKADKAAIAQVLKNLK